MAVGDTQRAGVRLSTVRPADVAADVESIRHFDQLDHDEQHAFLQLYRGTEPAAVPLDAGDVVVFTDYYRIDQ